MGAWLEAELSKIIRAPDQSASGDRCPTRTLVAADQPAVGARGAVSSPLDHQCLSGVCVCNGLATLRFPFVLVVVSGSDQSGLSADRCPNRTQPGAVISRVWTTSPRLPFVQVGHPGVEPRPSCSQSRRASICTSARLSVRTAGLEPAIPWPPTRCDNQASPRSASEYPVGESNPSPTGIRSPSACPPDGAFCARTLSAKWA